MASAQADGLATLLDRHSPRLGRVQPWWRVAACPRGLLAPVGPHERWNTLGRAEPTPSRPESAEAGQPAVDRLTGLLLSPPGEAPLLTAIGAFAEAFVNPVVPALALALALWVRRPAIVRLTALLAGGLSGLVGADKGTGDGTSQAGHRVRHREAVR